MTRAVRNIRNRVHPWRAVSVVAGDAPCKAARSLVDRRFLVAQAPRLPLLECPWPDDCDCTLRHHDDRRAGGQRAAGQPARRASDHTEDDE